MTTVSVILPTFARNANGLLKQAIESVLQQSFEDLELFIVDDGSTDGSKETIIEFAKQDGRVKHIRFEENVGLPALTTVEAFIQSKGKYIAWQFDDCVWMPDHLTKLLKTLDDHPNCDIAFGQAVITMEDSSYILGAPFKKMSLVERTNNTIPNCATLIKRHVYESIGWFDPSILLKRICDYDFWCRAAEQYKFAFCAEPVATENGCTLPDSLGRSVSLVPEISHGYMSMERNTYLHIENRANWRPYDPPSCLEEADRRKFAFLVFEHFLRVNKFVEGVARVGNILFGDALPATFDQAQISSTHAWAVIQSYNDMFTVVRNREREKDEYMYKQSVYIEKQHRYIENQKIISMLYHKIRKRIPSPVLQRLKKIRNKIFMSFYQEKSS